MEPHSLVRRSSPKPPIKFTEYLASGNYTPPPCEFNRVTIELVVTSRGRQFDRLGIMYLGDIEVFRTSTAEPTNDGIIWTYVKEMDQYNVLWKSEQKIIFDLGNLVNEIYTGSFNTTLTATFSTVPAARDTADIILPISAQRSSFSQGSAFSIPGQVSSVAHRFPPNIKKAIVSLSACGQSTEEFWYTNALSSETDTFAPSTGSLNGYSPFREVQLLIDGMLAGVAWPFPIIFTGGISPGLWRPIVGIDAFDLREYEIDITPWIGLLCDGGSHTFEIRVGGLAGDDTDRPRVSDSVGSYWVVSGKIFIFQDSSTSIIHASSYPSIDAPPPLIQTTSTISTNSTGANKTLAYNTVVSRYLRITSNRTTPNGIKITHWEQNITYSNHNMLSNQGYVQFTRQRTTGIDQSSSGYQKTYSYPLVVNSSFSMPAAQSVKIQSWLSRALHLRTLGPSIFPSGIQPILLRTLPPNHLLNTLASSSSSSSSILSTIQSGHASYLSAPHGSYSFGTTTQDFAFNASRSEHGESTTHQSYQRHVQAVNASVVADSEDFYGVLDRAPESRFKRLGSEGVREEEEEERLAFEPLSVRAVLGRGPGEARRGIW